MFVCLHCQHTENQHPSLHLFSWIGCCVVCLQVTRELHRFMWWVYQGFQLWICIAVYFAPYSSRRLLKAALKEMDGIKASNWLAPRDRSENDIRPGVIVLWEEFCSYFASTPIAWQERCYWMILQNPRLCLELMLVLFFCHAVFRLSYFLQYLHMALFWQMNY